VANSAWVERGFPIKQDYRKLLEGDAGATFETVDFATASEAARRKINAWVDEKTNHKIRELLSPGTVDSSTRLVLANAIYFKGRWREPFSKRATKYAPFHRPGQADVNVPLMHLDHAFRYLETESYQAVEIPYEKSPYAMVVWLPRKVDGLAKLEREWTADRAGKSLANLATVDVDLYLPRFRVEGSLSLAESLGALGMGEAFTPSADFSGISDEPLWISAVVHRALVEVDEEGTEAAAATAIVAPTAAPVEQEPVKKVFRADHPFLFAIRHSGTGQIMFLGRVETPEK
jgi:serpin B